MYTTGLYLNSFAVSQKNQFLHHLLQARVPPTKSHVQLGCRATNIFSTSTLKHFHQTNHAILKYSLPFISSTLIHLLVFSLLRVVVFSRLLCSANEKPKIISHFYTKVSRFLKSIYIYIYIYIHIYIYIPQRTNNVLQSKRGKFQLTLSDFQA